jgi:zinc and cadmium transporter
MVIEVFFAALLVMTVSLIGVFFVQKTAKSFLEDKLSFLVSFSAGVFLVTAGGLALEVFELVSSVWLGAGLISVGYVLAWLLHTLLPETHHHHDQDCVHSGQAARKIIIGDSIHNLADGVVLVVAFATSSTLGLAALVSIVIHEALQEVSEFFVLKQAGYSTKKALVINFTASSTILLGIVLGNFALVSHNLEIALLALSSGFFFHIVIHDLFPKKEHHEKLGQFIKHILLVIIGVVLMGMIAGFLGDSHLHEGEGDSGDSNI